MKLGILLISALLVQGCVHAESNSISVQVSAMSKQKVDKNRPLCFLYSADKKTGVSDFQNDVISEKIVAKCELAAKTNGRTVIDSGNCQDILVSWMTTNGKTIDNGSTMSCSSLYGSTFCSGGSRQSSTYYTKAIRLTVLDDNKDPVHEVTASAATESAGMFETTMIALCRAAMAHFPQTIEDLTYEARTDFNDYEIPAH